MFYIWGKKIKLFVCPNWFSEQAELILTSISILSSRQSSFKKIVCLNLFIIVLKWSF